jgi:hypothetical protein
MKNLGIAFLLALFISSCHNVNAPIVESSFVDSLINHYSPSLSAKTSDSNLVFWKKRMDSLPDNFVNGPEYASALASQFHLYGDIHNLLKADSLLKRSNEANQEKEPGLFRTLTSFAMLQHQFVQADSFLRKAIEIEGRSFPNAFTEFDVSFERGYYRNAKQLLPLLRKGNSYGYLFRRSKYEHYDGSLDSAISCMKQAADKAGTNKYLRQVALSNAADLCIHKGDLKEAYNLYIQSIKMDASDLHSIMGIGWIALVQDKNDSLAEKIFQLVRNHTHSPDVLLKLEQVAEARGDSILQKKYADKFVLTVSESIYGKMYSKYLVDLYTTVLHQPAKAVLLAEAEINNRPSPQVYAWYAWSLFCNNQTGKAYTTFKSFVSGMPLEGPELYYMGKMMKGLDKGYNAQEFFKAAYKNRYDLSPAKQKDLEKNLE